jgi:hypothetical protein
VAGARPKGEGAGAGTGALLGFGRTGSCCSFLPPAAEGAVAGASPNGDGAGALLVYAGRTGSCCSFLPESARGEFFGHAITITRCILERSFHIRQIDCPCNGKILKLDGVFQVLCFAFKYGGFDVTQRRHLYINSNLRSLASRTDGRM